MIGYGDQDYKHKWYTTDTQINANSHIRGHTKQLVPEMSGGGVRGGEWVRLLPAPWVSKES